MEPQETQSGVLPIIKTGDKTEEPFVLYGQIV